MDAASVNNWILSTLISQGHPGAIEAAGAMLSHEHGATRLIPICQAAGLTTVGLYQLYAKVCIKDVDRLANVLLGLSNNKLREIAKLCASGNEFDLAQVRVMLGIEVRDENC